MKKLSILLIGLVLISGFAFAQEPALSVSLSGEASVTWGYNLDTNATGFTNAQSAAVTLTLLGMYSTSKAGEGDVYGQIAFKDIEIKIGSGGNTTAITFDYAKLVAGDLEVIIAAAPSIGIDLASLISSYKVGAVDEVTFDGTQFTPGLVPSTALVLGEATLAYAQTTSGGVTVKYTLPETAVVTFELASINSYLTADTNAAKNDYAVELTADVLAIENVTLQVKATHVLGLGATDNDGNAIDAAIYNTAVGAKLGYSLAIADGITVVPTFGYDLLINRAGTEDAADDVTAMQIGAAAQVKWTDGSFTVGSVIFLSGVEGADPRVDLNISSVDKFDGGLTPVGYNFAFDIRDVLSDAPVMGVRGDVKARMDNLVPYLGGKYIFENTTAGIDPLMNVLAGVTVESIFPLTSLNFEYKSGNLLVADDPELGVITTKLTIKY